MKKPELPLQEAGFRVTVEVPTAHPAEPALQTEHGTDGPSEAFLSSLRTLHLNLGAAVGAQVRVWSSGLDLSIF